MCVVADLPVVRCQMVSGCSESEDKTGHMYGQSCLRSLPVSAI